MLAAVCIRNCYGIQQLFSESQAVHPTEAPAAAGSGGDSQAAITVISAFTGEKIGTVSRIRIEEATSFENLQREVAKEFSVDEDSHCVYGSLLEPPQHIQHH